MKKLTRRALFFLPGAAVAGKTRRPPAADEQALNRFARAYNEYVGALRAGLLDLRLWKKLEDLWERLE